MTDFLPPLSYVFDYHGSPEVTWSDGERTFVREYSMNAQNVIQAMEWQFQQLSGALRSGDPWAALSQAFPDIRRAATAYQELEGLPSTVVRKNLVRLYSQYAREWERFPAREHLAVPEAA